MGIDFIIFYIGIFFLGSIFGSFACCQAWRIHEKKEGRKLGSRSVCMNCGEKLKWFDNIPIFSWLFLRGKCRNCKQKIGRAEILSELGLGLVFFAIAYKYFSGFETLAGFFSSPVETLVQPLILAVAFIIYWVVLVYDAKWGELPVILMLIEIPFAIAFQFAVKGDLVYTAVSTGLLAGIYYLIYFFSKEKAVGGGDWILCLSIGIFLGRWELAIIELFLSNFAASIAAIPQTLKKDKKPIPFGPFLILSMLAILLVSDYLLKFLVIY